MTRRSDVNSKASTAVPAAPKAAKRASTKGRKPPSLRDLAERYDEGEKLTQKQRADVEAWARKKIARRFGKYLTRTAVNLALRPDGRPEDKAPEPVPLERRHVVILARLSDAEDRVRAAQCDIDGAHNRLNAVRHLAYGALHRELAA